MRQGRRRVSGFPARAGMDRRRSGRGRAATGIPRTRGDGPPTAAADRLRPSDSPHARGWTRPPQRHPHLSHGFPARAGMDRATCLPRCAPGRIPRTRGDGPDPVPAVRAAVGFPARAGMDPRSRWSATASRRIPRTRGDGPVLEGQTPGDLWDSPHARGWTPRRRQAGRHGRGFPARAGMDPRAESRPSATARIPRTRGDGPESAHGIDDDEQDSPHARGWTPDRRQADIDAEGFPARAGMDRRPGASSSRSWRIPRTRGDGPDARGRMSARRTDSPHARGWTRARGRSRRRADGFPARAGMDPRSGGMSPRRLGIPRTRGDEPSTCVAFASQM